MVDALSADLRSRLAVFREHTDVPLSPVAEEAVWRAALERTSSRRGPVFRQAMAFATACAIGAFAVWAGFSSTIPADVEPSPGAAWHREGSKVVVDAGKVRVRAGRRPLAVATPNCDLFVVDARVLFDVSESGTSLYVESGEVEFRDRKLQAGERASVEVAPLRLPSLSPGASRAKIEGCERGGPSEVYEQCLATVALGSELRAETALYELGLLALERGALELALARFRDHQRRFANGAFAPEASIAVMIVHQRTGRFDDARQEAAQFLARFPTDPRAAEVRAWLGRGR